MQCDLWQIPSGNMIACFDSEAEVLAEVRELALAGESPKALSVTIYPDQDRAAGESRRLTVPQREEPVVVEGHDLAERLRAAYPADRLTA